MNVDNSATGGVYKIILHGVGYRQESLSKNDQLGFYTTVAVVANNVTDIKANLPQLIEKRMKKHNLVSINSNSVFKTLVIEGVYEGNREDLNLDGFNFYRTSLIDRLLFFFKCQYLAFFDSMRILNR